MHLNYECLRDVLLSLEKHLCVSNTSNIPDYLSISFSCFSLDRICRLEDLAGYSVEDVFYVLYNLKQAGLIDGTIEVCGNSLYRCVVNDITYDGHMFLRTISNETIWDLLKKRLGPAFSASLPVIQDVASRLILASAGM